MKNGSAVYGVLMSYIDIVYVHHVERNVVITNYLKIVAALTIKIISNFQMTVKNVNIATVVTIVWCAVLFVKMFLDMEKIVKNFVLILLIQARILKQTSGSVFTHLEHI